jgi:flagellar basal body-associated protein FliL
MKQKDIALIILIVAIAGIMSLVLSKSLIVKADNRNQQVEKVEPISTTFELPPTAYFNNDSINPTQNIQIGGNDNQAPFKNGESN